MQNTATPLDELLEILRVIVRSAEDGQWDAVTELELRLLAAGQRFRSQALAPGATSAAAVAEAVALHEKAIHLCKERMDCVRPLIEAFDASSGNPQRLSQRP